MKKSPPGPRQILGKKSHRLRARFKSGNIARVSIMRIARHYSCLIFLKKHFENFIFGFDLFLFSYQWKNQNWWGTFVTELFFTEIKSRQGPFFYAKKNAFFYYCLFFYRGKSELGGINMSLTYFLQRKSPESLFCTVKCYLFCMSFLFFFTVDKVDLVGKI